MGNIYTPDSEVELTILQSLLEGEGIQVHIANDYLGPIASARNALSSRPKTIMVPDDQEQKAAEIIRDYLGKVAPEKIRGVSREDAKNADRTMLWFLIVVLIGWAIKVILSKN